MTGTAILSVLSLITWLFGFFAAIIVSGEAKNSIYEIYGALLFIISALGFVAFCVSNAASVIFDAIRVAQQQATANTQTLVDAIYAVEYRQEKAGPGVISTANAGTGPIPIVSPISPPTES